MQSITPNTDSNILSDKSIDCKVSNNAHLKKTVRTTGLHAMLVNPCQRENPILKHIRNIPWEYSKNVADYVLGETTCALFLSLRYHQLYPEYIYRRIQILGKRYRLRILLILVDIDHHEVAIRELTKTCIIYDFTMILSWSFSEAGRYLETYKSFEHASFNAIQGKNPDDYYSKLVECFTTIRNVNRDDAFSIIGNFRSLKRAINADKSEILMIGGWGEQKVNRFKKTVTQPFVIKDSAK